MFSLKAPAKINWSLWVLGRRDDGYHDIITLMQCIDLCDTLFFEPSPHLEVVTSAPIPPESNLVRRAALALRQLAGTTMGARISLEKRVPLGAGLGGGSSDAAAALTGLNRLWGLGLDSRSLADVGRELGSDVPFFFMCPLARAEGRGDLLSPLGPARRRTLLVVKPSLSVSTAWAYRELAAARSGAAGGGLTRREAGRDNINLICKALGDGDLRRLESLVHNDFEDVVIGRYPAVGRIKSCLKEAGASPVLMSGSGSAVFGLFPKREEAHRAAGLFPLHWTSVADTLGEEL